MKSQNGLTSNCNSTIKINLFLPPVLSNYCDDRCKLDCGLTGSKLDKALHRFLISFSGCFIEQCQLIFIYTVYIFSQADIIGLHKIVYVLWQRKAQQLNHHCRQLYWNYFDKFRSKASFFVCFLIYCRSSNRHLK